MLLISTVSWLNKQHNFFLTMENLCDQKKKELVKIPWTTIIIFRKTSRAHTIIYNYKYLTLKQFPINRRLTLTN